MNDAMKPNCATKHTRKMWHTTMTNMYVSRFFSLGSLVLKKASIAQREKSQGKLSHNWEGLYIVDEEIWRGTYCLKCKDGTLIPNTWHIDNFRQYYA